MHLRRSDFGRALTFAWEGFIDPTLVDTIAVDSTLDIPSDLQEGIASLRADLEADPREERYDGKLWRFEGLQENDRVKIALSPTSYAVHMVVRGVGDQDILWYANPVGVSVIQETADGYLLLGVRGSGSEYSGLSTLGSGFIEREEKAGGTSEPPQSLIAVIKRECEEETEYKSDYVLDLGSTRMMGVVLGEGRDVGPAFHVPIGVDRRNVGLNSDEHCDLIFLPNDLDRIEAMLRNTTKGFKGLYMRDDVTGILELYVAHRKKGNIVPQAIH